ncbi:hypothetical protein BH20GEM2_BH20GEM2_21500 [soil metagenome]
MLIAVGGLIALGVVIAIVGGGEEDTASPPAATTDQGAEETQQEESAGDDESAETEEEEQAEPPPPPAPPPQPRGLTGSGSAVENVRLRQDAPLVVGATHSGSANFIVELVPRRGGSDQLLINEIGSYTGEVAYADASAGRYRITVEADGAWQLNLAQPQPRPSAARLPGRIRGEGSTVTLILTEQDFQAVVSARHRGQSNFIVEIIGHGDLTGSELLFNEIGNFEGETLTELPAGGFLVAVQADGRWTLRVTR